MLLQKVRAVTQFIGTLTVTFLAIYGAFAINQNANYFPDGGSLVNKASAAPISLETTNLAMQASSAISSTVPPYLNYQGILRDGEGNPMDGEYDMTFRIYDAPADGLIKWDSELVTNITVRDGRFSVLLGHTNPLTDTTIFAEPDTYLGVTVEGFEEMVPRQRFASVPYAIESYGATRADGLRAPDGDPHDAVLIDPDGNVQVTGNISIANALTTSRLDLPGGGLWSTRPGYVDFSIGNAEHKLDVLVPTGGLGAGDIQMYARGKVNRMVLHGGDNPTLSIWENRVGVNNIAPSTALDVNGDLNVSGDILNLEPFWVHHRESHNGDNWPRIDMGSVNNRICFLTRVTFEDIDGFAEKATCDAYQQDGRWWLIAETTSDDADAWCGASCLSWGPE